MNSLRVLVEKWLSPMPATPVRITRFGRTDAERRCHVRVEASHPKGALVILFFRHGDGAWQVFPPTPPRLTMRAYETSS